MKKILLLLALMLPIVITSCSKDGDDEKKTPIQNELDIQSVVNLIDTSVDNVKKEMSGATLVNESNTLGKVSLGYQLPTNEAGYLFSFKFNENNKLYSLNVSSSEKFSNYSDAINFTKKISDRINKIYKDKKYNSYYMDGRFSASFDTPEKYWNYITEHQVKDSSYELRILRHAEEEGDKMIYQNIELWFSGDTNNFIISVEKNEY